MSTAPTAKAPAAPVRHAKVPPLPPLHGPWPSYGWWSRRWPPAGRPAGATAVLAVAAAATVAAVTLPIDRPGVGWPITALAGTAALLVVRAVPERSPAGPPPLVVRPPERPGPDRFGWAAATVALLAVGAVRSAGWLFLLCLATATLTGALAMIRGTSMRGIAAGYTMPLIAGFRALPWLVRGVTRMRRPGGGRPNVRIVATVAVSVALLTVFGALFASAEPAFADALAGIAPDLGVGPLIRRLFVFTVAAMAVGGAVYLRATPPRLSELDDAEGRVSRLEWAIPLSLLVALFAAFVAVQLSVLFGGDRHVRATDGLTYAGYARGGFWH
jgi:hypothetical protein